ACTPKNAPMIEPITPKAAVAIVLMSWVDAANIAMADRITRPVRPVTTTSTAGVAPAQIRLPLAGGAATTICVASRSAVWPDLVAGGEIGIGGLRACGIAASFTSGERRNDNSLST